MKNRPTHYQTFKKDNTMTGKVELYKDGDNMGIVTSCQTENDFMAVVCRELDLMIRNNHFFGDWEFQLNYWLPQIIDICLKYRGLEAKRVGEIKGYCTGECDGAPINAHEICGPAEYGNKPESQPISIRKIS